MFSNHLFGPRNFSSLSLEGLMDNNKNGAQMANTAHTSATALLQKAAQMGATASGNVMGPPMMQRGFAGVVGSSDGGFNSQFMQKDPAPEMSAHFFHSPAVMNDMAGVYSTAGLGLFMGGDQDHDFMKNLEHESSNSNSSNNLLNGSRSGLLGLGGSRFGGRGSGDPMTVDFMGVGGSRAGNLHEQQQQQQQGLGFEGLGQERLHGLHHIQEHFSHGPVELEKPMWNV